MSMQSFAVAARAAWASARERIAGVVGWNKAYRGLSYLRSALWVVPIISVLLALITLWTATGIRIPHVPAAG